MKFRLSAVAHAVGAVLFAGTIGSATAPAVAGNPYAAGFISNQGYSQHHGHTRRNQGKQRYFERVATFPVHLNSDISNETVAEIVSVSKDGNTLIYTDGVMESIGFVDITDAENPQPAGILAAGGEPTSVAVAGKFALVAVNTSPSYTEPAGKLLVVDIETHQVSAEFDLGGQPDSVAISPDGRYAAIAIENERDEDLGDGRPPQNPAGFLTIVDIKTTNPANWGLRQVSMTGVADLFPSDPEPEYVDINRFNVAAVSMQENNHIAFVHLPSGRIINDWSAGTVDLDNVDIEENDDIEPIGSLRDIPREPDGLTWISPFQIATADEGDLDGGSRGFTTFDFAGNVSYAPAESLEHLVTRIGHYPESRSENKGSEFENVDYGKFGNDQLLFVGSERASVVFVYKLVGVFRQPEVMQVLPTALAPEGLLAIPERGLFVTASEADSRDDKFRSSLTIFRYGASQPDYPSIYSSTDSYGQPIAWGALSALAVAPGNDDWAYTIADSYYRNTRIYPMDISSTPAVLQEPVYLYDDLHRLAAVAPQQVEADGRVSVDAEGLAVRSNGGYWVATEGAGSVDDAARPVESQNLLIRVADNGVIDKVVSLPDSVNARQRRFGFEGVAVTGSGDNEILYVAFQREWLNDPKGKVRIGRYDTASGEWRYYYYPLDAVESVNGGWIGLSEITALGNDEFAVIERDNQANTDAAVKRLYRFSLADLTPVADPAVGVIPEFPLIDKTLVRDMLPDMAQPKGAILEKIEGMAVLSDGTALVVNDNDGVDDSNGETQLFRLQDLF